MSLGEKRAVTVSPPTVLTGGEVNNRKSPHYSLLKTPNNMSKF